MYQKGKGETWPMRTKRARHLHDNLTRHPHPPGPSLWPLNPVREGQPRGAPPWQWNEVPGGGGRTVQHCSTTPLKLPRDGRHYEKPQRVTKPGYDLTIDDGPTDWKGDLRQWANQGPRPIPEWKKAKIAVDNDPILSTLEGRHRAMMEQTSQEARDLLGMGEPMTGQQKHPNLLHTLKVGPLDQYAFRCPPGTDPNKAPIPGSYLPSNMRSTQALFGMAVNKCGSNDKMAFLSKAVPQWAPRYLTHDCFSLSASLFSNFRQTRHQFLDADALDKWDTVEKSMYKDPPVGWECAACAPPNPNVKPYGRYKRALEKAGPSRSKSSKVP